MSRPVLLSLCLSAAALPAAADPAAPAPTDPIVVVANRSPEAESRTGQSVSMLDAETLAARQTPIVSDLVATLPGVSVARSGGPGAQTSLFIRGAESAQTLVVIDGVAFNDPASPAGGFDFGNLLVGDIDRIELLRGPQSTLWGSQAIGGVVSITTRRAARPFEADGQIEAGSYGTRRAQLGAGGDTGALNWRLSASQFDTDGVSAYAGGHEADGFRQSAVSGRATYAVSAHLTLDLRALYSDGKAGIDGYPPPAYRFADTPETSRTRQFLDYTGLDLSSFGGRLHQRLAFQYAATDRVNDDPTAAPTTEFYARGHAVRTEYQGTWTIRPGAEAVFGAQHERTTIATAAPASYDPHPKPLTAAADIDSAYGQVRANLAEVLTLTGGARIDHHSAYGDHTTVQAAAAWRLGAATVARASFGQGFKAPTLYQLYSPYGFPGLKPETANGADLGVEQRLFGDRALVSATLFERRTRDQVDFFGCYPTTTPFCASRPYGYYDNIARTRAEGLELAASARPLDGLDLTGAYTFTHARDDSPGSANRGRPLARRPEQTASVSADYRWSVGPSAGLSVRYAGASFDNAANTVRLKAYTLVDVRASAPLGRGLELYGRVENLFDQTAQTAFQYGSLGRAAYVGLRARF